MKADRKIKDKETPLRLVETRLPAQGMRQQRMVDHTIEMLGRQWFSSKRNRNEAATLALLLMAVYKRRLQGLVITKKEAMAIVGADERATANRYIEMAVNQNLLIARRWEKDERFVVLGLTDAGIEAVESELDLLYASAQRLMRDLDEGEDESSNVPPALNSDGQHVAKLNSRLARLHQRADQHLIKGDYKAALRDANKLIRLQPDHSGAHRIRAELFAKQKQWKKALEELNPILEKVSSGFEYRRRDLSQRAEIYESLGRYDDAIRDLKRLVELMQGTPQARDLDAAIKRNEAKLKMRSK